MFEENPGSILPGHTAIGKNDSTRLIVQNVAKTRKGAIVLLLPTATDDSLGADQWAGGPTFVALKQIGL